jgi:predicted patatin/cPLA2 family phospholipase
MREGRCMTGHCQGDGAAEADIPVGTARRVGKRFMVVVWGVVSRASRKESKDCVVVRPVHEGI